MTKQERWRPIPGWDGRYSVSDQGRVKSNARIVARSDGKTQRVHERILKAAPDRKGYLRVNLFRNNEGSTCYIHQMVLSAFVGPQQRGTQSCHGNGNRRDNRLGNLRYDTDSANKLDAVRHGTHANARKTHCPSKHPYDFDNTRFGSNGARYCKACQSGQRLVHR